MSECVRNILGLSLLFVIGCTSTSKAYGEWSHPAFEKNKFNGDNALCEVRGYEVAGPRPRHQSAPDCQKSNGRFGGESTPDYKSMTDAFYCGREVRASNRRAIQYWKSAFNAGFKSCMYQKGYIQRSH